MRELVNHNSLGLKKHHKPYEITFWELNQIKCENLKFKSENKTISELKLNSPHSLRTKMSI